jgi:Ca-activated chloride channel family protein
LAAVIGSIERGGTTNLSGGWLKGAEELRRVDGDGQRRVLLLTDGHANVGVTDGGQLSGMAQGIRGERISTTTIGFGRDFDEVLLTAMADAGGGNGYFAEGPDDSPGIFNEEFDGLATVSAQNVSVEIAPISDVKFIGVLNEYPMVPVTAGVQVQLGDFYGGELRRVVFEFAIPNVADLGQKHIADVVLRYTTIGDPVEMHDVTIPVHVNVVEVDEAAGAEADREVVDEVLILKAAEDRKRASDLADVGRYDEAAAILDSTHGEIRAAMPYSTRSDEMSVELNEMTHSTERMRSREYDLYDKKRMHYESQRNRRSKPRKEWENPEDKDKW